MPIYEYECGDCGKKIEILVRSGSGQPGACPECGSKALEKLISIPGAVLKSKGTLGGGTCCGRTERCEIPPCGSEEGCSRDQ